MRTVASLTVDVVVVLVFAAVGRASHGEDLAPAGLAGTAWPFLVAVLLGSLLGRRLGGTSWWRQGLVVWLVTLAVGTLLRLLGGASAAPAFVVVAACVLGVGLVGWRGLARLRLG